MNYFKDHDIIDYFLTDDTDTIPAGINNVIKFNAGKITYLASNLQKQLEEA